MRAATPTVRLISFTPDAEDLLIFTKQTRLELSPTLLQEIKNWSPAKKLKELEYMANTIPSSWEFVDYCFLIAGVSRAFTHQLVRTRSGSYAQQTMRMIDMTEYEYVYSRNLSESGAKVVAMANAEINAKYRDLIEMGEKPEDARGILPTNIATNIIAKFNLRTLCDLIKSRTGGRTQDEYQLVASRMADEVLKVHPWADMFMFQKGRDYFAEVEEFAKKLPLTMKPELLKIVDKMRKGDQ